MWFDGDELQEFFFFFCKRNGESEIEEKKMYMVCSILVKH